MRHRHKAAVGIVFLAAAFATRQRNHAASSKAVAVVQQGVVVPPPVVKFSASDFSYAGPDTIQSGETIFQLTNNGPSLHHIELIRLDSGKTMADLGAAMKNPGPPPAWAVFIGGPNAPDPGATTSTTLNVTPGNYVVACLVDQPGGVPHIMKGMAKPLTVVQSTGPKASVPAADMTVSMKDYGYDISAPITAGRHTLLIGNHGTQPHEFELVKLDSGKTVQELLAWIPAPKGPPPGHALGGVNALAPYQHANEFTADFTPGHYAIICFVPDAKDGKPHFMHGMIHEFTVN